MEKRLKEALQLANTDYAEVRVEEITTTLLAYAGNELESIGTHFTHGGGVRACHRGGWGFVSFSDLSSLKDKIRMACEQAKLVGRATTALAPIPRTQASVATKCRIDPAAITLEEKEALARAYNEIIMSAPHVQTSHVRYRDRHIRHFLATSEGNLLYQERIYTGVFFAAIAKDGSNVQTAFESVGEAQGYEVVQGLEEKVERVTRDAVDLLKAQRVEGGEYSVVLDQRLAGTFVHEAFGHLSEADHVFENERLKKLMALGTRFGPEQLSIVDDGTLRGKNGSFAYDDEGVSSQKTYLIENGLLVGRLHSRETAAKMGEAPTGNARALNFRHRPLVRMTCTYIEPRDCSFEEMIGSMDDGIYASGALGGTTELEQFTFSSEKAYRITKGKIGTMIRDVVLSGNVFETLKNIEAIGDDLVLFGGLGGCCKNGQGPLPVSDGSPHLKISKVLIG